MRDVEREDDPPRLAGVGVAELELDAARDRDLRILVEHAEQLDVRRPAGSRR